ncbi:hypothetical protein Q2490_15010 [Myroides odoratimimus]|uniref:hypothetical protein n=1 Tax=Myroides odoratimimus TaxID=76832 RepID=UPI002574B586|nr:hypothetical protein [Myroides odoratimimus]MDM1085781.1 hypothetical protein [Myroides odoratimimus]MDO5858593.1 hypothetical protein [Myroides odoratimimus]
MRNVVCIVFTLVFLSCSSKKEDSEKVVDKQVEDKGFFTKTKEFFVDSDEIKNDRRLTYLTNMDAKYPDYKLVLEFFDTPNNPFILESEGDLYRIIDSQIDDAGSKVYKYEEQDVLMYFYKAKENFYIYSFSIDNAKKLSCISVRRIGDGMFKTDMHDIVFENNKIIREDFKGEFSTKFYKEDKNQYFRYSSKVNGDKVVNTLNLGVIKEF